MKVTLLLTAALAAFALQAPAQTAPSRVAADQIPTQKGPLTVQPITHGSVVFTWNGKTIYVDPYGGAQAYAGLAAPDVILITDIHGDHLDPKTLAGLSVGKALLVVPPAVAEQLPAEYQPQIRILRNGQRLDTLGLRVAAIPMYNLPQTADARHPKGRGNGYVLTLGAKMSICPATRKTLPRCAPSRASMWRLCA
ncbi:MBL fold metallo-hydrolase [Hymenobacter qilianensis]|uniref:MBL fold metallo-hydrolase n=1 Tax=Hymenobacter qilianensis TaxID=1385715 RepID=UPI00293BB5FD|nr:MBL fold metallo-hydrolase [Hymenobacter qilianensis]